MKYCQKIVPEVMCESRLVYEIINLGSTTVE